AFQVIECEGRRGNPSAVDCCRYTKRSDQSTPGPRANEWSNFSQSKIVRKRVSAGSSRLIDQHYFRTVNAGYRRSRGSAVAKSEVTHNFPVELVDDVVRDHAAVIVALIDHGAVFVLLRVEVTRERRVPRVGS